MGFEVDQQLNRYRDAANAYVGTGKFQPDSALNVAQWSQAYVMENLAVWCVWADPLRSGHIYFAPREETPITIRNRTTGCKDSEPERDRVRITIEDLAQVTAAIVILDVLAAVLKDMEPVVLSNASETTPFNGDVVTHRVVAARDPAQARTVRFYPDPETNPDRVQEATIPAGRGFATVEFALVHTDVPEHTVAVVRPYARIVGAPALVTPPLARPSLSVAGAQC